jgi:hypothetical protein
MEAMPIELEGTWEEIVMHADALAGRRVRVTVLPIEPGSKAEINNGSPANSLLKYAGSWAGDDLEECLQLVYDTRSQAKF